MNVPRCLLAFGLATIVVNVGGRVAAAPKPREKPDTSEAIFNDLKLPPLKGICVDVDPRKLSEGHIFADDLLQDYLKSKPTFNDIRTQPAKFEGDFPIRVATVTAVDKMRELGGGLPDEIRSPITPKLTAEITKVHQRTITVMQATLEELNGRFVEVDKIREQEKSKGWLAQWDYLRAQVKLRLAWCYEYNLALGKVKLGQLPALNPNAKHNGWRLVAVEKMVSPKDIRDTAEEAKSEMGEIAEGHPKTPWAALAVKHKELKMGLKWEPVKLD
jgi:hypothetical protein